MDVKLNNTTQGLYKSSTAKTKNAAKSELANEALLAEKELLSKPGASTSYDVSLSTKAQEMRRAYEKALQIAMTTPDVREDKVAEWKERLKNGNYQVSSENIADGLLKEAMKDHLTQMG